MTKCIEYVVRRSMIMGATAQLACVSGLWLISDFKLFITLIENNHMDT